MNNADFVVANNKGDDQPAHPRSLISTFIFRLLAGIILYSDPHFQRKMFQECNFNEYTRSCRNHCTGQGLWQTFNQSGYEEKSIIDQ